MDQHQENGHCYTVFVDSTAATDRVRNDVMGPGQRFAIAAMRVCGRLLARDNKVTIHWVSAHSKMAGMRRRMGSPRRQRGEQPRLATRRSWMHS